MPNSEGVVIPLLSLATPPTRMTQEVQDKILLVIHWKEFFLPDAGMHSKW